MINIIVCVDINMGISKNGVIPWKNKIDMDFFKDITTKTTNNKINAVIMGKNTWKSIPSKYRGLKERYNIIVSTTLTKIEIEQDNNSKVDYFLAPTLEKAIEHAKNRDRIDKIFICGGRKIYQEALEDTKYDIQNIYFSQLTENYECDNLFPVDNWIARRTALSDGYDYKSRELYRDTDIIITHEQLYYNNHEEHAYLNLLNKILMQDPNGRDTRNAVCHSIFGADLEFDVSKSFPALTTKRLFFRGVVEELLFFLRGNTNANDLMNKQINIWKDNTTREFLDNRGLNNYEEGDMGPMYGFNWRHYGAEYDGMNRDYSKKGYDQLRNVIDLIINDPDSRRIMMTTFDPSTLQQCVLAPCHGLIVQFYIRESEIDCIMYQRSADMFLGVPFNIASYALLMHIISHCTGYNVGKLKIVFGDTHIYSEHIEVVKEQMKRATYPFPQLLINKERPINNNLDDIITYIEELCYADFELINYKHHPALKAKMIA